MEESRGNSEASWIDSAASTSHPRGQGIFTSSNIVRSPLSTLLEYSGILRNRPNHSESGLGMNSGNNDHHSQMNSNATTPLTLNRDRTAGEVSIRIIGPGELDHERTSNLNGSQFSAQARTFPQPNSRPGHAVPLLSSLEHVEMGGDHEPGNISPTEHAGDNPDTDDDEVGMDNRDALSPYPRNDIQLAARWIEHALPFSLLLLLVLIRQHLQGFCVTIWLAAFLFKSNDIVRKQTALKGERNISVVVGISLILALHVVGVYWWYHNDDLLYPLVMLPPTTISVFWNAIFIIMVNDTLIRQAAMVFKCVILMRHKNGSKNYRKQGQVLTLIEYLMLLYRTLIPAPVWYRFFLNKEYGTVFSSLTTGLYLTFKLSSVVEKVQTFIVALRIFARNDIHYGTYATPEQVTTAGDLCAICQEKMNLPVILRCKHIFCEECVSEWFERERTCPLCRALIKTTDLKSFGDGSTSLFFQLF